jgi:hypothetical protein
MFDFLVSRGGRLGEEEAARVVMKPLMSALAFLHSQSFLHRVRGGPRGRGNRRQGGARALREAATPTLVLHAGHSE